MKGDGVWTSLKMGTLIATLDPRRRRMLAASVLWPASRERGAGSSVSRRHHHHSKARKRSRDAREADVLVDDLVADKERLHRPAFDLDVRVAEGRVGHAQPRPGRQRHGQLVGRQVAPGELAPEPHVGLDREERRDGDIVGRAGRALEHIPPKLGMERRHIKAATGSGCAGGRAAEASEGRGQAGVRWLRLGPPEQSGCSVIKLDGTHSLDSSHWRSWTTPASLVRISPCESERKASLRASSNETIRYSIWRAGRLGDGGALGVSRARAVAYLPACSGQLSGGRGETDLVAPVEDVGLAVLQPVVKGEELGDAVVLDLCPVRLRGVPVEGRADDEQAHGVRARQAAASGGETGRDGRR
jgi:hypothetical protein